MKTYVIGDIHGGLRALQQVLSRSPIDIHKDRLIFLGDYVDGWSESKDLIDYLIDLQSTFTEEIIFIRGNHDKWCEDFILKKELIYPPPVWMNQGGKETIESYGGVIDSSTDQYIVNSMIIPESHKTFFKNLRNYYIDTQNRGFVHGGFVSRKGLGFDAHISNYYWDRDLWGLSILMHNIPTYKDLSENAKRCYKHKEIFIGHTATTNHKVKPHYPEYDDMNQHKNKNITVPMNRCNVWNLDTGGGFKGKLTIMDIDTKQYWQSDFVKNLYPEEKGR